MRQSSRGVLTSKRGPELTVACCHQSPRSPARRIPRTSLEHKVLHLVRSPSTNDVPCRWPPASATRRSRRLRPADSASLPRHAKPCSPAAAPPRTWGKVGQPDLFFRLIKATDQGSGAASTSSPGADRRSTTPHRPQPGCRPLPSSKFGPPALWPAAQHPVPLPRWLKAWITSARFACRACLSASGLEADPPRNDQRRRTP